MKWRASHYELPRARCHQAREVAEIRKLAHKIVRFGSGGAIRTPTRTFRLCVGYAVVQLGALGGDYLVCSSRIRTTASDLIAGAASRTTGNIVSQAINQDASQFRKKLPAASEGRLAMAAAIRQVKPDWMTAKTKWV